MEMLKAFNAARRVSTPIVVIRTPDNGSTVRTVTEAVKEHEETLPVSQRTKMPVIYWDIAQGISGFNPTGKEVVAAILKDRDPVKASSRPTDCLDLAKQFPEDTILFMANTHEIWDEKDGVVVRQALANVRDPFKMKGKCLVCLTMPGCLVPPVLANHVMILDEPLPTIKQLEAIVTNIYKDVKLPIPEKEVMDKAADALLGLAAFPAEQRLSMVLTKEGLDTDELWEAKRQVIGQTPGLSVFRTGDTFDKIGGVENLKKFGRAVLNGKQAPRGVMFIDEIEKSLAGFGTDSSGVTTKMVGALLSWMQDKEADGLLLIGPPGCTKSMFAKAFGNEGGIPTIAADLAGMQSSLVGSSEERLRNALNVVDAVTGGRTLVIATCNRIGSLPPELRRRFNLGTFFCDLPTNDEQDAIWTMYQKKYKLTEDKRPKSENWTGAEIRECCKKAWKLNMTLKEAATYVVPVAISAKEEIKGLRRMAGGKFISASQPGIYQYESEEIEVVESEGVSEKAGRKMRFDPSGSAGRA